MGINVSKNLTEVVKKHGNKIALITSAIFIFVIGVAFGSSSIGFGGKLSASLSDAWNFTKDSFSRAPVAEFNLKTGDNRTIQEVLPGIPASPKKECDFDADTTSNPAVIFTEIAWMGTKESYRSEWIELQNHGDGVMNLAGWSLTDESGKFFVAFPDDAKIEPEGFYLLAKKGITPPGKKSDAEFSGTIRNSDQTLKLFGPDCAVMDAVTADPSWPAGDNETKQTMERDSKTLAWHTSIAGGGTPGAKNSAGMFAAVSKPKAETKLSDVVQKVSTTIPSATTTIIGGPAPEPITAICFKKDGATPSRTVLINEVAWSGTASDKTSHEWIELKNNFSAPLSLKGWQIMNRAGALRFVFTDLELTPGGLALLERTDDETVASVEADFIYSGALKNSDETLQLFDSACTLSDEVVADVGTSKAWPAGTAASEYRSMERSPDFTWHTFQGSAVDAIFGTPKKPNTVFVSSSTSTAGRATFTLSKTGVGSGVITSEPSGIQCGSVCSYAFPLNTNIVLSATPDPGSQFMGWNGCVGFGACSMMFSGNIEVVAEFQGVPAPLPVVPPIPAPILTGGPDHLIIVGVQVAGAASNEDEYIAISNPTGAIVPLSGWSVQYRGPSASTFGKKNFTSTHSIIPGTVFIIANPQYTGAVPANMTHSSFTLTGSGGSVFLVSTTTLLVTGTEGSIVDRLAYGVGTNLFPEGTAFPDAPAAAQVLTRKSTAGVYQDTDNNALDFDIK